MVVCQTLEYSKNKIYSKAGIDNNNDDENQFAGPSSMMFGLSSYAAPSKAFSKTESETQQEKLFDFIRDVMKRCEKKEDAKDGTNQDNKSLRIKNLKDIFSIYSDFNKNNKVEQDEEDSEDEGEPLYFENNLIDSQTFKDWFEALLDHPKFKDLREK